MLRCNVSHVSVDAPVPSKCFVLCHWCKVLCTNMKYKSSAGFNLIDSPSFSSPPLLFPFPVTFVSFDFPGASPSAPHCSSRILLLLLLLLLLSAPPAAADQCWQWYRGQVVTCSRGLLPHAWLSVCSCVYLCVFRVQPLAAAAAAALSRLLWTRVGAGQDGGDWYLTSSRPASFDITFTVEYLPPLPLLHILPFSASSPSLILHPLSSLPSFNYFLHLFFAHNHPLILCFAIFFMSFFRSLPLSPSFSSPFSFYSRYYSIQISLSVFSSPFFLSSSSSSPPLVRVMAAHLPGVLVM